MAAATHQDAAASFDPLRPKLMRVAYRMLGSVADAEDVLQEAFIRWMGAKRWVLALLLVLAIAQYYYLDVLLQIASLNGVTVFSGR